MSLNKFMHPKNRYKNERPNFKSLGEKYPEFQEHLTINDRGKPVLDFQNPEALRVLTICMMKEDYGFKIELPADRLVPTLPLRLNYVHWIEDITKGWNKEELKGIDIGTGACCVYPLLAISANPWQFLATEADEVNFSYAQKNLEENKLTKRIRVMKVSSDVILEGVIGQSEDSYDFSMCNPPFFSDHFEAQGLVSRSPSRPEAKTMSTASPQEGIVQGGEVAFVRRMIEESNFLQHRVRVYTTMLGKKASLAPLKEILRRFKITNFGTTEFCQGKTMRWGLAWSFDQSVTFPKSLFSQGKKEGKKSVVHLIYTQMGERREPVCDLVVFFKRLLAELKIHVREGKQSKSFSLLTLTAAENTWIHSRRKRRQMQREAAVTDTSQSAATETSHSATTETSQSAATETSQSVAAETSQSAATETSQSAAETSQSRATETSQSAPLESSQAAVAETSQSAAAIEHKIGSNSTSQCENSTQCQSNTEKDTAHCMENRTKPTTTSPTSCVKVCANSTEGHSDTAAAAAISTSETDRDQEPPLASVGQCIPCAEGGSGRKRMLDTGDESDSLPAKRLKEESSEQLCDKQTVTDELPADSAQVLSKESKADEEMETDAAPSNVAGLPLEGDGSCCAADTAVLREEGEGVAVQKGKDRPPSEFVLKCHMSVRVQGSDLAVELVWLDGQDIQLMHQLMQVFKNRLAQRDCS